MNFPSLIARQLRRLANALSQEIPADTDRMRRFMSGTDSYAEDPATPGVPAAEARDSGYWPDATDPLAQVHGHAKCIALERKLFAMTVVAWMAHADQNAKVAAAAIIARRVPGFGADFLAATQEAIDFTKTLQHHIAMESQAKAEDEAQDGGAHA